MPLNNLGVSIPSTREVRREPKPSSPSPKRTELKKELRILVECLGFGHGKYKEFPEYAIQNSSHLKARIYELIEKL